MLRQLERKLGRFAIPNLTLVLIGGQVLLFLAFIAQPELADQAVFIPSRVMAGEWWRLVVFFFLPPETNVIFLLFALYLLYLMGTALEHQWGTFRYNLYLLIGWAATIGSAWIFPNEPATNGFILTSIFLAFAFLYPDFVLYIFLILPVKVKWLALITWGLFGVSFLIGDWASRALILAAVANFGLFFWPDLIRMIRGGRRRMKLQTRAIATRNEAFHTCIVCGKTDKSDPNMDFRYCPQCVDSPCYCAEHIHNHEHQS